MKCFDFIYDFASPNVYLMHKIMGQIEKRTGATARYVPVLLGGVFRLTDNTAPMQAFGHVKNKLGYERRVMRRFIERYEIPFLFNPHFPVMTTAIMRGAIFCQGKPYELQYRDLMFDACWQYGLKMDDPEVIENTLENAGLPAADIVAGAQTQTVKEALFATTQAAVDRGVFGAPMMFVGDEPFFGKDSLPEMEWTLLNQS